MERYVQKLKPNVSGVWRADELYLKFSGNQKYLYALMDDETRYLIAQEVGETKFTHDAKGLFQMGQETIGRKPDILITDGLAAYHQAYKELVHYQAGNKDTPHQASYLTRRPQQQQDGEIERRDSRQRESHARLEGRGYSNPERLPSLSQLHSAA